MTWTGNKARNESNSIGPITRETMERTANTVRAQQKRLGLGLIDHKHCPGSTHTDICNRCGGWEVDHG